jgi:hypothetical protein
VQGLSGFIGGGGALRWTGEVVVQFESNVAALIAAARADG